MAGVQNNRVPGSNGIGRVGLSHKVPEMKVGLSVSLVKMADLGESREFSRLLGSARDRRSGCLGAAVTIQHRMPHPIFVWSGCYPGNRGCHGRVSRIWSKHVCNNNPSHGNSPLNGS